jgi:hypothetical protein
MTGSVMIVLETTPGFFTVVRIASLPGLMARRRGRRLPERAKLA